MPSKLKNEKEQQKIEASDVGKVEDALATTGSTAMGAAWDMSKYAGMGNENVRTADKAVPYLVILQKNSPQVDKDSDKCVEGAEVGMIYNTVTGKLRKSIVVVNCHFVPCVVEWVPRDLGGGFVAEYSHSDAAVTEAVKEDLRNDKNKLVNRKGNTMVDTARHFVLDLDVDDDTFEQAIIAMTSTQHKPSRVWNSTIENFLLPRPDGKGKYNPPRFSCAYELTTKLAKKDAFTYYNWSIGKATPLTENEADVFLAAAAFYESASQGKVQVGTPQSDEEQTEAEQTPGRGDRPF